MMLGLAPFLFSPHPDIQGHKEFNREGEKAGEGKRKLNTVNKLRNFVCGVTRIYTD
jgi:hypothetical protein